MATHLVIAELRERCFVIVSALIVLSTRTSPLILWNITSFCKLYFRIDLAKPIYSTGVRASVVNPCILPGSRPHFGPSEGLRFASK